MWYRNAQALNIVSPIYGQPGAPAAPPPQQFPNAGDTMQQVPQQVPESAQPDIRLHQNCHCEIKTFLGGRQVWRTGNDPCEECQKARDAFNTSQEQIFGSEGADNQQGLAPEVPVNLPQQALSPELASTLS